MTENDISTKVDVFAEEIETDLYNVIFHNDDYTPMEFVVIVIAGVFQKEMDEALDLTMEVHKSGKAIVAQYIKEVAEYKKTIVDQISKSHKHPLKCTIELAPKNTNKNKLK